MLLANFEESVLLPQPNDYLIKLYTQVEGVTLNGRTRSYAQVTSKISGVRKRGIFPANLEQAVVAPVAEASSVQLDRAYSHPRSPPQSMQTTTLQYNILRQPCIRAQIVKSLMSLHSIFFACKKAAIKRGIWSFPSNRHVRVWSTGESVSR